MSDVVDDSVNGASQPPIPEGTQPAAPTPAETPVDLSFPDAVAPLAPAAEIAVSPAPLGDGLTGELQALTAELETPPAAEPVEDAAAPAAPTAEPAVEPAAPSELAEAAVAVAEEPAQTQDAANTTELVVDEPAEPAAEGDAPEAPEAPETPESGDSLDDIAPGTVTGTEEAPHAPGPPPITSVPSWPFVAYVVLWLGVAGFGIWKSMGIPAELALFDTDLYRLSVLTGLVMLAGGPLLLIVVWFASWIGRANTRKGAMFISALIKGACATLAGAIIWWGALLLMDYLRLGRLL